MSAAHFRKEGQEQVTQKNTGKSVTGDGIMISYERGILERLIHKIHKAGDNNTWGLEHCCH